MIDLRSDTVTRPTRAMRQAMADAEVGDDVIDVDPTVQRLEQRTAELLGKEAAIYMPSGSMTNQIAIRVHCGRGEEFLCEADCHVYNYEQGAFASLSGLVARTIQGDSGVLRLDQVRGMVRPDNDHSVRTRMITLENTHNRGGGRVQPFENVKGICDWAKQEGLTRHLDGARLWNAVAATGIDEATWAAEFDSVSVCFSKGLGAPVGSALVGSHAFVQEARRARKLFGGGMRQAGIIAAGALYAIEHHRGCLVDDHAHAQLLAEAVRDSPGIDLPTPTVDTNIVIASVDPAWGTAAEFRDQLAAADVSVMAFGPQAVRFVTHRDVDRAQIDRACQAIRTVAQKNRTSVAT